MLTLAETLVTAFCQALGFRGNKRHPRVDVYELAERAGAEAVLREELREDGRVEESQLATRILLWSEPAETRRRFTLGHELGHLVLSDPKVFRLVQWELKETPIHVEHLCDAFSAELLMPRKWLTAKYAESQESLDVLYDIAGEAEVSLSASLIRLTAVLNWHSSLLYFRGDDIVPSMLAGPTSFARVELGQDAIERLRALTQAQGSTVKTLDLRIHGVPHRLQCELRATRSGTMCLVHMPHVDTVRYRHAKVRTRPRS